MYHYSLVDLLLFSAVAEESCLTRGARKAHLSLPSASLRMKSLEEALHVTKPRGIELTPAGEILNHLIRAGDHDLDLFILTLAEFLTEGALFTVQSPLCLSKITLFIEPLILAHRRSVLLEGIGTGFEVCSLLIDVSLAAGEFLLQLLGRSLGRGRIMKHALKAHDADLRSRIRRCVSRAGAGDGDCRRRCEDGLGENVLFHLKQTFL